MPSPSLLVIGLDAATFDVIDPLVEAGDLPHLAGLLSRGARGRLRSTVHPLTPLAWTTMTTGVNAARHGIWDFSERDETGYRLRLVNGSHSRAPALWTRLSAAGRRVGIVNVPFTWPAPEVDGFVLAGIDAAAREDGMTSPPELVHELQQRFGRLLLDHSFPLDAAGRVDLALVERTCDQRLEIVDSLVDRFDPELLFVVFMAADHVHHLAWPDWEERGRESDVAAVYRILDDAVGRLLRHAGEETDVLVVSDHGGGRLDGVVNLNAWLSEQGYLAYADGGSRAAGGAHRVLELRRKLPERWRYAVKQRLPGLRERTYRVQPPTVIDWANTRAFAYGVFGNVALNVAGRERDGTVRDGEEYDRLREELRERLLELEVGGRRIVAAVHRREDLYQGPELERLPDLIVEFDDYAWLGKGNLTERTTALEDRVVVRGHEDVRYAGGHRLDGIFVLAGPSARAGATVEAGIADVAPTIMYLLGEAVPSSFEGRLLAEALLPTLLDERPLEFGDDEPEAPAPTREESPSDVEERLRSLGYLE